MSDVTCHLFTALTQNRIASLVAQARNTVAVAAPGISREMANAIVTARGRGTEVHVVLDCNDDVIRIGYGEVEAIRSLMGAGIRVRQCPGLRIGILIIDDQAWTFTPTPLCVERERQSDETPNAVGLTSDQAKQLMEAIAPPHRDLADARPPEIGTVELESQELSNTEQSLKEVPRIDLDLQRQVRVFQPYIQYVELSLIGCSISRHTVALPPNLAPLAKNTTIQKRLRTTFALISEKSKIDDKPLQEELAKIRKDFARNIKALSGSVMLRGKRSVIDARLDALQKKIDIFKETVRKKLATEVETSLGQLKKELLPLVLRNPPEELRNQCMGEKPSKEEVDRWVEYELRDAFPTIDSVVGDIELRRVFKDVTYESLNNPDLRNELRKAFPAVPWDRPFKEFDAAQGASDEPPNLFGDQR